MVRLETGEYIRGANNSQIGPFTEAAIVRVHLFNELNMMLVQLQDKKLQVPGNEIGDLRNSVYSKSQ